MLEGEEGHSSLKQLSIDICFLDLGTKVKNVKEITCSVLNIILIY